MARLHEYEGKRLLKAAKVPVAPGDVAATPQEARAIAQGRMDKANNPLKNAPHTVEDLVGESNRPYSRETACFPAGAFRVDIRLV